MRASRHEHVGEVFLKARALLGREREAYLDQVCAGDAEFRADVESLLAADSQKTNTFLREAPGIPASPLTTQPQLCEGQRVGQYVIQREIGSGGMGTVFEALQERPRRRVALKVLRHGFASAAVLRRFEYESQVLAMLRHPAIAQVYEAGIHESPSGKVPYFAMEFVPNALPIHEFCRTRAFEVCSRLELFVKICDAVEHAHRNGVIHRDLNSTAQSCYPNTSGFDGGRCRVVTVL